MSQQTSKLFSDFKKWPRNSSKITSSEKSPKSQQSSHLRICQGECFAPHMKENLQTHREQKINKLRTLQFPKNCEHQSRFGTTQKARYPRWKFNPKCYSVSKETMEILKCLSQHQKFSQISKKYLETHQKSRLLKNHQNLSEALPCEYVKKSASHHIWKRICKLIACKRNT